MVDLAAEMARLAQRLGPPPGASARVVQFVSGETGAGVSSIARAFALEAARGAARGVWLVELDLMKGEQHAYFEEHEDVYGRLGPSTRASPNDAMFFTVTPKVEDETGQPWSDSRYLSAQAVGARPLWVTRFRREALRTDQSVRIQSDPAYWRALRPHADYVVVDAPALTRSEAACATASVVDCNVLVLSAAERDPHAARALRDQILAAGGVCAGAVLTHAPPEPPALLRRLLS